MISLRRFPSPEKLLCLLVITVLLIAFLLLERMALPGVRKKKREKGLQRNVVLLGQQPMRERVYASIRAHSVVYDVVGTFSPAEEAEADNARSHRCQGGFDSLLHFLSLHEVHEIYCEYGTVPHQQLQQISLEADRRMIRLRFLFNRPDMMNPVIMNKDAKRIAGFGDFPVLTFRPEPLQRGFNQFLKRSLDIVCALMVIIGIMSWLIPLLALLIKLDSKGPVFFRQLRSGKNNQPFLCYKFRSMRVNDLADTTQATLNDDRFTRIGRFLRRTSLDELPQFFNVLRNDMSVVGPRPHMLAHTEKYKRLLDNYMVRHFVKPGITGWAQVSGFRGETKKLAEMEQRVQHDVHYLENWSFLFDLKIIFRTICLLLKKEEKAY